MHLAKDDNRAKESADRPAIEISNRMIEAGLMVLASYDPGWSNDRQLVVEIFKAMSDQRLGPGISCVR